MLAGHTNRLFATITLCALALLALAAPVQAQGSGDDEPTGVTPEQVAAITDQLVISMGGSGPGVSLTACSFDLCQQWKGEIEQRLLAGEEPGQIVAAMLEAHGDFLSPAEGAATTMPPAAAQDDLASRIVVDEYGAALLSRCGTDYCADLQAELAAMLDAGDDAATILAAFEENYGTATIPASEQLPEGVTWNDVNAVAKRMYCDVCEGIPLDECESQDCRDWRLKIAYMLGIGYDGGAVMDYFVANEGADVASLPRDSADRFLVFAIPTAIVLVIGAFGALQMRRLRQRGHHAGQVVRRSSGPMARPVPDDIDPDYLDRLEQELKDVES